MSSVERALAAAIDPDPKVELGVHAERHLQDGQAFILDAPDEIPALWGHGSDILWSAGEGLFITGPQGVGKSALAQQLVLARHGITAATFLGFPVEVTEGLALYIAADRPRQIARSLRRMVSDDHAELLRQRLRFWAGPLPFDIVREPQRLASMAQTIGANTLVIDSLKDIASPLSSDEVGAGVNRALGTAVATGIEVVAIHHSRKATAENRKPTTLADVYGSTWVTSGAGSVISLWGEPGDPLVELTHLKQPADDVGPLELEHDHQRGITRRRERADVWSVLQGSAVEGVTASDAATAIYGRGATRAQVEKVRRRLERHVEHAQATPTRGASRTDPVVFRPTGVKHRVGPREGSRDLHAATRTPGNTDHGGYTHPDRSTPPLKGEVDRVGECEGDPDLELDRIAAKFGPEGDW